MSNIVLKSYPIHIETFSSNVRSSSETFPTISSFTTYSKQRDRSDVVEVEGINFLTFRKNKNEIGKTYYRNGILDKNSLNSYIENRRLFVQPGEYTINGETVTLLSEATREQATETDTEVSIDNFFLDNIGMHPRYGTISSYIYKTTENKDILFVSPKDNGNTDQNYINPTTYIAYDVSADLNDLVVNNYVSLGTDSVQRLVPGGTNLIISDVEESPDLVMENIGTADGSYDLVFQTKYYPISIATGSDNTIEFFGNQKTHIAVKDAENNWTTYRAYNTYIEAESSGNPNSCYLDRFNGKIYFARETFKSDTKVAITGHGILAGAFSKMSIPYAVGELLDDNGFFLLSKTGLFAGEEEEVRFDKINNTTIEIKNYEQNYTSTFRVYISPLNKLTPPNGDVYVKYSAVIGFQKEINTTVGRDLSAEIQPWLWSGQKTIAVLGKSTAYPYYINLKCVDVPFVRYTDSTAVYGPLYSGSEIVLVEGEVLSYDGNPIASQEVEVFLSSGTGLINLETSAIVVTDDLGKFYASYNPQASRFNWVIFKDSDIVITGSPTYTTKLKVNPEYNDLSQVVFPPTNNVESILYAIKNDDGAIGSVGTVYHVPSPLDDEDLVDYPPYQNAKLGEVFYYDADTRAVLIYDGIREEDILLYNGSTMTLCFFEDGDLIQKRVNISNIVRYPEAWYDNDLNEFRFMNERQRITTFALILDNEQESLWGTATSIFQINLHTKDEIKYDADALNGKKVVLAENKPEGWGHPSIDNLYPVYGPVMTASFNKEEMEYTINRALPTAINSPESSYSPGIVGYAIHPDSFAVIQAKTLGKNSKYIYSNKVGFEIKLANRDIGVVTTFLSGLKVPYGFRLYDDNSEDSSTIGVNTFLTVNSLAGSSTRDPQFPLISYIDANGIIYLGNGNIKTPFDGGSSSVNIKIGVNSF